MACVLVLNCLLLILLNIFLTVSASRSPLPRYVVGEDIQRAIFGSSAFDPVKQCFDVNVTEQHEGTAAETGSTKSPGGDSKDLTLRMINGSHDTVNVKEPWRKIFNSPGQFSKEVLRERIDTTDVTDTTTLDAIVATVSSTNPRVEGAFDAFVSPETVNKMTNEENEVKPIPKGKVFTPVLKEDGSLKLKEETYDNKLTETKIETVEPYKKNLSEVGFKDDRRSSKQEPQDDYKKNESKLVAQLAMFRGRADYDNREVNELPF